MKLRDKLRVDVSADAMMATILPIARYSRSLRVRPRHVVQFLADAGVTFGVLEDQIADFLERWNHGSIELPWIVCRGVLPVAQQPSGLRRIHPPARSGRDAVELLPLFVKKGEALFERTRGTDAKPGRDVHGDERRALQVDSSELSPGRGIQVEGSTWMAESTGFLQQSGAVVEVVSTLIHKRDMPRAEYHWAGDAEIRGDVGDDTHLRIGGSLRIDGRVGSGCVIEVSGDLVVGKVHGGRTTRLEVVGTIDAQELQDAHVLCGGDIVVRDRCRGSVCRTRGKFICTDEGSQVIGGAIEAVAGADIVEVGDSAGTPTHITVGRARWVADQIITLDAEIRSWVGYTTRMVENFESRYENLLEDRSQIHKLSEKERLKFEEDRASAVREEERIDRRISEIRSLKQRLVENRFLDSRAVARVGRGWRGSQFTVRTQTYDVRKKSVENVVLCISPTSRRLLPVPQAIFDSADSDSLFTGESEYVQTSR